jgi:hypothetical protein
MASPSPPVPALPQVGDTARCGPASPTQQAKHPTDPHPQQQQQQEDVGGASSTSTTTGAAATDRGCDGHCDGDQTGSCVGGGDGGGGGCANGPGSVDVNRGGGGGPLLFIEWCVPQGSDPGGDPPDGTAAVADPWRVRLAHQLPSQQQLAPQVGGCTFRFWFRSCFCPRS